MNKTLYSTLPSSFVTSLGLVAATLGLSGCVNPQQPSQCITGTLVYKGSGPTARPHLHAGQELYLLDFVRDDYRYEPQTLLALQGQAITACGGLTPESAPLPSRLRVDQMNLPISK